MRPFWSERSASRRSYWVFAVLVVLTPGRSWGLSDSPGESFIQQGLQARKAQRDADALDLFQKAYQAEPSPRALAQIGLAEQALSRWAKAERHLEEAMHSETDPWISKHRAALTSALAVIRDQLATVITACSMRDAELWLDGVQVGKLPLPPQRVEAGTVRIELRAPGRQTTVQDVALQGHESTVIVCNALSVEPVSGGSFARAPLDAFPRSSVSHQTVVASYGRRNLAWVALSSGLIFLVEAVIAHALREYDIGAYNDDARCLYGSLSREQRCGKWLGASQVADVFAKVGYSAAALSLLGSGYLFFTLDGSQRSDPQLGVRGSAKMVAGLSLSF